jgi:putative transposase
VDAKEKRRVELAEYKFGLIAPAVNGTYPDPSMAEYFRRVCAEPVGLPDGTVARLKPSTLASWRRRYLKLGFEGLMPKGRSDLGTSRRIDADLGADIQAMRAESPRISAKMVHERLVEEGHVAAGELSVATVQRWFRNNPLPEGEAPAKDRRAFESARVNGIWQADTLYGPHVGTPPRRAYLQAIIDDKSRKVVSARFVERDDAASFQGTLRAAVASHGVPERLFVDNGGPYRNGQLSLICGELGIVLLHAAVRDGAAKGKIERFNRTLRMRFLSVLPEGARASMGALNAALAAWVAAYNATVHSSTRQAPNEAFAAEADRLRWLEGGEGALDEAFRNRVTRKVAPDATVRVDHVLYDAPMGLVGERVELRWTPGREGDVWIVMPDGSRRRLAPTDKAANAEAPRVRPYSIDWGAGEVS